MRRLKPKEVAAFRKQQLEKQGGVCPLCLRPIEDAGVLDHCHKTGLCRGTLHRSCNAFLGKLENGRVRYGLTDDETFRTYLENTLAYIHSSLGVLHHTHRTEEEKRLRRNAKARKARAIKRRNK